MVITQPRTSLTGAGGAPSPTGDIQASPQRATLVSKSVGSGDGDGPPRPHPLRQGKKGSDPRRHAGRTSGGEGESAQPHTPLTGAEGTGPQQGATPAAKSMRCFVGDRPKARIPRAEGNRAAGPRCTPKRRALWAGIALDPGHVSQRHQTPPLGHPPAAPTACNEGT